MTKHPKISLSAARVNAGLSQREAAKKLRITVKTLQNYETGKTIPNWDTVRKIEAIYNFPIDYIFLPSNSLKASKLHSESNNEKEAG